MRKMMICALAAALALALGGGALAVGSLGGLPGLADFTATTLYGEAYGPEMLAEADLTVVNIWSVTCPPCIQEMPELAAFARRLPENVRLIAICPDAMMIEDEVKQFLEEIGFESPTLVDGDGDFIALMDALMYTPSTLFLDSAGEPVIAPLIGSPPDVQEEYLKKVNSAMMAQGKPVIELEDEADEPAA